MNIDDLITLKDSFVIILDSRNATEYLNSTYNSNVRFLFEEGLTTYKIKKPKNGWLLDSITKEISLNKYPLFISEGKSETKLKAIQGNSYLTYCLNQLEKK